MGFCTDCTCVMSRVMYPREGRCLLIVCISAKVYESRVQVRALPSVGCGIAVASGSASFDHVTPSEPATRLLWPGPLRFGRALSALALLTSNHQDNNSCDASPLSAQAPLGPHIAGLFILLLLGQSALLSYVSPPLLCLEFCRSFYFPFSAWPSDSHYIFVYNPSCLARARACNQRHSFPPVSRVLSQTVERLTTADLPPPYSTLSYPFFRTHARTIGLPYTSEAVFVSEKTP